MTQEVALEPSKGAKSVLEAFKSGWPIVATSAYGTATSSSALLSYPLPYFMQPLHDEFGWSRGAISTGVAWGTLAMTLTVPIAGRLCDRFGVRKIIPISIALMAATTVAVTQITADIRTLYAAFVVMCLVGAGTTFPCYTRAVAGAFDKGRGMALGFALIGTGVMAMIAPLALPPLIDAHGWRAGYLALAAAAFLGVVPALLFLRDPAPVTPQARAEMPGLTLSEAMRSYKFWFMIMAGFLTTAVVTGTQVQGMAILTDLGVAKGDAERTMALYGVSMIVSRIAVGILVDRIHAPKVAIVLWCAPAIGLVLLGNGFSPIAPIALMMVGMIAAGEGDLMGFLTSRMFGLKAYAEIFGWFVAAFCLGGMAGAIAGGQSYDLTGDYKLWLYGAAGTCLFIAVLLGTLGKYRFEAPH